MASENSQGVVTRSVHQLSINLLSVVQKETGMAVFLRICCVQIHICCSPAPLDVFYYVTKR